MRTPRALTVGWASCLIGCAVAMAAPEAFAQPVAANDFYSVDPAAALSVSDADGILKNDTGASGNNNNLQAVLVSNVTNGLLVLGASGAFLYIPGDGFSGNDSFTYQAREDGAVGNVATVTIRVISGGSTNGPPIAQPDNFSTNEGQTLTVGAANGVLANDTDPNANTLTAVLIGNVQNGTLALQPDGSLTYTPPPNGFSGTVSFTYEADDGIARSAAATATITVNAVNEAPSAQADSYTTAEDTPIQIAGPGVLTNDTDPDNDALTAQLVRAVSSGTLRLDPSGSFSYMPQPNFAGTATFTYRARDASAQSAETTVTIAVTAVNDPPFPSNTAPTAIKEGVTYQHVLAVTDVDSTPTITATTLPSWLKFTPPATISGTPGDADVGTHTVTMSVTDGIAPPVTVQWQITVENVDIRPTISAIPEQTATENSPFDLDLRPFVRDTDTDAAALLYAPTSGIPAGLTLSSAGRLSGTPQIGGSVGSHTVRFTVRDADPANTVSGQFRLVVVPAGRVDLGVTMSASPSPVTLETPATWTIVVTNRAPQVQAQGASLKATFAGEVPFRFDAPTTTGCTLMPSGEQTELACALGPLAGGASTTITLTGRGSFPGDVFAYTQVAVTGAGALDETNDNDSTTASLSIAQRIAGVPAQRIALPDARAAAAGDFNADGFDDLVVATGGSLGVVLFTNVADATNSGRRALATPPQALGGEALGADVAVADLDRDGDPDIVLAASAGAPDRAYLSSGPGGAFTTASLGNTALDSRAVTTGDINGDAFVDLVFANPGASTVLINTGSGARFNPPVGVGSHDARDVLLVDLFGDTLPELVVADGNPGAGAAVYRNTRGAFTLEATLATGATTAVSSGDFNGDGRTDLVFARATPTFSAGTSPAVPSALVWLNTPGANSQFFVSDELGAAAATGLLVRDFNIDTRPDVLASNGSGVRIFTNAGAANGTFALHPQQLATPGARGAVAGKFSSDDRVDLAVVGDGVSIFVNDGAGNFGQPDSNAPVIQLRGDATVNITIDAPYVDAGATATDKEDGDITSRIVVTNAVDTKVLGSYTVTYSVSDLSGNAATPVTRTVNVQPQPDAQGGGGGALGLELLALLLAAAITARNRGALAKSLPSR
jgi:hypothetical protein